MTGLGIGTICVKVAGRKAGEKVVVLAIDKEKNFATVMGEKVKKKRCNLQHLMPLNKTVKVSKNVSQKELAKILKE